MSAVQKLEPPKPKSVFEEIDELMRVEEEGRLRAFNRDSPPVNDFQFLHKVYSNTEKICSYFEDMGFNREVEFCRSVQSAALDAADIAAACSLNAVNRGDCIMVKERGDFWTPEIPAEKGTSYLATAFYRLASADAVSRDLTGRRCTYLLDEVYPYPFSAFLNDLTSCYHALVDVYRDRRVRYRKMGKCVWSDW